ncbi:translocation/assembly module TamB domain-containing protein [Simiduia curdlanivorans]|uniref:Translocation/assembly module TamB domain-containing protein n=1 Tax=Simiduia curdlanivorans TaxID=1492769 RepID=A0ABV8V415_9GAMM|nr:translocation/assembly module TamB domain-containing protein [Simiduia curdlanivorans]MDN3637407.1 translocation/assembly module TamB domain-containing protein [Simiduia curdlanivorans]
MVWLRRLSIVFGSALLLLVIVPFLLCSWLIFTTQGAQWGVRQALPYVPVKVTFTQLDGSLWSGLIVRQLAVEARDDSLGFESVTASELSFSWQPLALLTGRIQINQIDIKQSDIRLADQANAEPKPKAGSIEFPELDLPFNLEVQALRARGVRLATATGLENIPDLDAKFWLGGNQLILSGLKLNYGQIDYELSGRARFSKTINFSVKVPSHGVNSSGECTGGVHLSCSAQLVWKDFSHPITDDMQSPSGDLTLELDGDRLSVKGEADYIWSYEYAPIDTRVHIEGLVDFASSQASVASFTGTFAGGEVKARGTLSWQEDFSLALDVEGENVSLAHWLPEAMQESQASLHAKLALSVPDKGVQMRLDVPAMNVNFGAKPLRGGFTLVLNEREVKVEQLNFIAPGSKINVAAALGFNDEFAVRAVIDSAKLQDLIPELSGKANVNVDAKGNIYTPNVTLNAETENLRLGNLFAQSASLEIGLQVDSGLKVSGSASSPALTDMLRALRIEQLSGAVDGMRLDTTSLGSARFSLAGRLEKHELTVTGSQLLGQFDLDDLHLAGSVKLAQADDIDTILASSSWQAQIKRFSFRDQWFAAAWTLAAPSRGEISAAALVWQPLCLSQSTLSLCLDKLTLTDWHKLNISGDVSGFYLDRERSLFPEWYEQLPLEWKLNGELIGRWQLDADFGQSAIDKLLLSAQVEAVKTSMIYTESDEPSLVLPVEKFFIALKGDEHKLSLGGEMIFDQDQSLVLVGDVKQWQTPERAVALNVKGGVGQLAYLQPFLPGQRDLVGVAQADISVLIPSGSDQLQYQGKVVVSDAGMSLPASGTQLSAWQLVLEAERGDLILNANGKVGEGLARVEGRVLSEKLNDQQMFQAELDISGKNIHLVNLPDVQLIADPSLKMSGNGLRWHLTGDIRVHDSSMVLRELPVSAAGVSEDAVVYGRDEPESKTGLIEFTSEVVLGFDKNVAFEGFGLSTDVGGELRFTRDQMRLNQVHGVVLLTNGRFRSYGQKLDIESGQIIFSGPIDNPALSVLAVRKVDDIVVGIQLAGSAKHPKTELYSDKAMSEADILSYMVSGKPISQSGAGEVVDMQSAALGLGLKQALPLLQRIGGEFGISDITVEDGSDGGSSIAAGKRITDKLYVKYVYGLLGAAGNFVVQYKISDQLGIETTSGDSQAIDLTYRWDSTPPEPEKKAPVSESTPIP